MVPPRPRRRAHGHPRPRRVSARRSGPRHLRRALMHVIGGRLASARAGMCVVVRWWCGGRGRPVVVSGEYVVNNIWVSCVRKY